MRSTRSAFIPAFPLFLLFLATPAAAPPAEGIGVGINGGLLFSTLDFGRDDDFLTNEAGFIGGLLIGGNRGGLLGVEADISYAREGSRLSDDGVDIIDRTEGSDVNLVFGGGIDPVPSRPAPADALNHVT